MRDFKSDFDKWVLENEVTDALITGFEFGIPKHILDNFYNLTQSMQWGVYLNFFDSVNIDVPQVKKIDNSFDHKFAFFIGYDLFGFDSRDEGNTKAIKQAINRYERS